MLLYHDAGTFVVTNNVAMPRRLQRVITQKLNDVANLCGFLSYHKSQKGVALARTFSLLWSLFVALLAEACPRRQDGCIM